MRARPSRRLSLAGLGAALALHGMTACALAQAPKRELAPLSAPKIALVEFENSPFPYRGEVPEKSKPFIDVTEGARLGHTSPARRRLLGGPDLQRSPLAALHPARLRCAPAGAHRGVLSRQRGHADARRPQPPAGAAAARRVRAQRRAGGAAIRRQRARLQRRPILGAGRVPGIPQGGDRAADRAPRRRARARGLLRRSGRDRRL